MLRRIVICSVLACGAFGPSAAGPVLPAVHAVSGVSEADALNVRAGPSTAHPVIGRLPNGAEVEVTGLSGDGWARLLLGEGDGWAALRYLKVRDGQTSPDRLYCGGTEPFWGLTLKSGDQLLFTRPEQEPVRITPKWTRDIAGRSESGFALGAAGYVALFNRRECSDGMSDRTYGWALDFLQTGAQGAYLQGCCRLLP